MPRVVEFHDLGVLQEAKPPSKVQVRAEVRVDRRSAERIFAARRIVLATHGPSIVDVVRANAAAVLTSLLTIDQHFQESGRSNVDWSKAAFDLNLIVTNWLTTWRLYREHSLAPYRKGTRQREKIETAQRAEFDGNRAYRLTEGLRDFVTHVDLPPTNLTLHEELDATGSTVRFRRTGFDPNELLERWNGWKSVKRDLEVASQPIALDDLVPSAMASLDRIESLVAAVRRPSERRAARIVVRAASRVESLGGLPCLITMRIRPPDEILGLTPLALPVNRASELLH